MCGDDDDEEKFGLSEIKKKMVRGFSNHTADKKTCQIFNLVIIVI
jgi:hypothetical protein